MFSSSIIIICPSCISSLSGTDKSSLSAPLFIPRKTKDKITFTTSEYRSILSTRDFKTISDCWWRPLEECLHQQVAHLDKTTTLSCYRHFSERDGSSQWLQDRDIIIWYPLLIYMLVRIILPTMLFLHISLGFRLHATIFKEPILTLVSTTSKGCPYRINKIRKEWVICGGSLRRNIMHCVLIFCYFFSEEQAAKFVSSF